MVSWRTYSAVSRSYRLHPLPRRVRKDLVDKRKAWREQEQQLVQNWNAAAQRYREIMAQIATENPLGAPEGPSADIMSKAAAVRAEIEALRKKVARLKAEFNSGKRY